MRTATVTRETTETQISITVDLDGTGKYDIDTGVGFFDHMLTHVAKHGTFDLTVKATGDLHIDAHHTVEDVGIVLGQALAEAVGDKKGIGRYGGGMCPMDEALVYALVDFGGRAYLVYDVDLPTDTVGQFDAQLIREFFLALTANAGLTLHLIQQSGDNTHHILEGAFKSFARALDEATTIDPRKNDVPSTKGVL